MLFCSLAVGCLKEEDVSQVVDSHMVLLGVNRLSLKVVIFRGQGLCRFFGLLLLHLDRRQHMNADTFAYAYGKHKGG